VAMVGYGVVYALASLSCTIGPFLAITTAALGRSFVGGIATYVSYALGMGLMILAIATCAALVRPRPVAELRRLSRHASRAGGLLMMLSGAYAIWYARWELAVYSGDLRTNRVVEFGERWRQAAVDWVDRIGAGVLAAIIIGTVAIAFGASQLAAERKRSRAAGSDTG
jgi:cytochrome c-type biogenesis protein